MSDELKLAAARVIAAFGNPPRPVVPDTECAAAIAALSAAFLAAASDPTFDFDRPGELVPTAAEEADGRVLVPLHMTREMERVVREGDWEWADLLAAAQATTLEQDAAARSPATQVLQLWVCGKHRGSLKEDHPAWELQGVFDTEDAAVEACTSTSDFVGPVLLNQHLPQDATEWPNCRFPLTGNTTSVDGEVLTAPLPNPDIVVGLGHSADQLRTAQREAALMALEEAAKVCKRRISGVYPPNHKSSGYDCEAYACELAIRALRTELEAS